MMIVCSLGMSVVTSGSKAFSFDLPFDNMQAKLILSISVCIFCQQLILFPPKSTRGYKIEIFFSKLADFSYSLYLIHRILLLIVFSFFFGKEKADLSTKCLLEYIAIVMSIMLVTYVIYYVTERRTNEVKRWIKIKLGI